MPNELVRHEQLSPIVADQVRAFAGASLADSTKTVYAAAWRTFERWCAAQGHQPLPAAEAVVAGFLANTAADKPDGQELSLSTVEQRLASIFLAHKLNKLPSPKGPDLDLVVDGIRRRLGAVHEDRVVAVRRVHITAALATMDPLALRTKLEAAVLLVGHAGALRRSEIREFDLGDAQRDDRGFILTIRRSKTDQYGEGATIAIPRSPAPCPVEAMDAWLKVRKLADGPLFKPVMSSGVIWPTRIRAATVAHIIQRCAKAAKLEGHVSGHSLRAGFVTDAVAAGADVLEIARQTRHKDLNQLKKYIRELDPFKGNAVGKVLE